MAERDQDPRCPVPAGGTVQLRVHGVSGTPPEELLDTPLVVRCSGDAKAGFHRPRLAEEQHHPAGSQILLEGYAWGGLTSGAPARAFWLLLLPFTLVNVAPRLRPPVDRGAVSVRALWYTARLMAVAMTVLIVVAVSGVALDLFAWQCATGAHAVPDCSRVAPGWLLGPVLRMSREHRLLLAAVVPLLLVVLFWQLSGRTIRNYEAVRVGHGAGAVSDADAVEPSLSSRWMWDNEQLVRRLRHLHLQAGLAAVLWLVSYPLPGSVGPIPWRAARWSVATAVAAWIVVALAVPSFRGRAERVWARAANTVVWALEGACAVALGRTLGLDHPLDGADAAHGLPGYAGTAEAVFVALVAALVAFTLVVMGQTLTASTGARGGTRALGDLSGVVVATLAVFLGAVFSSGVYVFASGWLLTGSLRPGFAEVARASRTFDTPVVVADASRAYAVSMLVLVAVLLGLGAALSIRAVSARVGRRRGWPSADVLDAMVSSYPDVALLRVARDAVRSGRPAPRPGRPVRPGDGTADDPSGVEIFARARSIGRAIVLARVVDRAHRVLAAVVGVGAVIAGFFVWLTLRGPAAGGCLARWHAYRGSSGGPEHEVRSCATARSGGLAHVVWEGWLSSRSLQGTGAYLVVLSLLLLVGLGAAAFRSASTRRSLGILWDLASFWPRAGHPFAAPCYAERAVPDLVRRVSWLVTGRRARVVLAAHSQGTVIAAAVLWQLATLDEEPADTPADADPGSVDNEPADTPVDGGPTDTAADAPPGSVEGVGLFTFGCVLRRLYARYFPAYFGVADLEVLRAGLLTTGDEPARWRNLWRHTDYLGGQVMSGPPQDDAADGDIDVRSVDPPWSRRPGDTVWPPPDRHSAYWRDPAFAAAVTTVAGLVRAPGGPATTSLQKGLDP